MSIREYRRGVVLDRMADYVLSEGLAGATLRPLAAAAGTSDRMLLYYFIDKEELLSAILETIAARILAELNNMIAPRLPFAALLHDVWAALNSPRHRPYMNIWYDLASGAARGLEPHRQVSGVITDSYLVWIEGRLMPDVNGPSRQTAALFLAALQGLYLLDAIGRPAIARDAMTVLTDT